MPSELERATAACVDNSTEAALILVPAAMSVADAMSVAVAIPVAGALSAAAALPVAAASPRKPLALRARYAR